MLINSYVYKGPHNTLLAPCILGSLRVPEYDYEDLVPSVSRIYDYRKNLNSFSTITHNLDIHISTIDGPEINSAGDTAIKNCVERSTLAYRTKAIAEKDVCYIKHIKKPITWSERLLIILTVFYRRKFLESLSDSRMNLLELESNYNKHLDVMCNYKYLPPIYHWEKSMNAFKNVFPRPLWYVRELQTIEKINRGL